MSEAIFNKIATMLSAKKASTKSLYQSNKVSKTSDWIHWTQLN